MEFKKLQSIVFWGVLAGITAIFLWMLRPYFYPIFWAAVLATLFYPLYKKLFAKTQKPNLSAAITLIIIILIVLIPLSGIASLIIQQGITFYHNFGNQETFNKVSDIFQQYLNKPLSQRLLGQINIQERLSSWGGAVSSFIYSLVTSWGQNTVRIIFLFFIMLYALFYFLRDGEKILKNLMHLLPLGDQYEKKLYHRFVSTARATLKGTLLIGLIQGSIGGLAFFITGVPASIIWSLIMVVLCIIPSVGAGLILLPAAIIFLLLGNFWQAIVILIALVIAGIIDNILRGPLVGKDTQMHPLFIFFATLGGLIAFGVSGIVIGPVITAFLLSIWEIYEHKYKTDLDKAD